MPEGMRDRWIQLAAEIGDSMWDMSRTHPGTLGQYRHCEDVVMAMEAQMHVLSVMVNRMDAWTEHIREVQGIGQPQATTDAPGSGGLAPRTSGQPVAGVQALGAEAGQPMQPGTSWNYGQADAHHPPTEEDHIRENKGQSGSIVGH